MHNYQSNQKIGVNAHLHTQYQLKFVGEANSYNPEYYGCAIQQMVADWRNSWFQNTPSMDPVFPFGEAQVHRIRYKYK